MPIPIALALLGAAGIGALGVLGGSAISGASQSDAGQAQADATRYASDKNYESVLNTNATNRAIAEATNAQNLSIQQQNWSRDDTAIQRRKADLEAAGLNPMLAAAGAGNTASFTAQTGAPAQAPRVEAENKLYKGAFGSAMGQGIANLGSSLFQISDQMARTDSQVGVSNAQKDLLMQQATATRHQDERDTATWAITSPYLDTKMKTDIANNLMALEYTGSSIGVNAANIANFDQKTRELILKNNLLQEFGEAEARSGLSSAEQSRFESIARTAKDREDVIQSRMGQGAAQSEADKAKADAFKADVEAQAAARDLQLKADVGVSASPGVFGRSVLDTVGMLLNVIESFKSAKPDSGSKSSGSGKPSYPHRN